jgi:hypothetical protein
MDGCAAAGTASVTDDSNDPPRSMYAAVVEAEAVDL